MAHSSREIESILAGKVWQHEPGLTIRKQSDHISSAHRNVREIQRQGDEKEREGKRDGEGETEEERKGERGRER